jgi:serine/threonine protein phosphatase PrpC
MKIYSSSIKGLRKENEDKFKIINNLSGENKEINDILFCGIYDGHGGKGISNFLYNNVHNFFMSNEDEFSYPYSTKFIYKVFDNMQKYLQNNKKKISEMQGSTCLIVIIYKYNDELNIDIINVGDSRCMICRDNFGRTITKDHKPNWPDEKKRIENLGGKIYYDGYDWRIGDLSLSRAIGDNNCKPYVSHIPDIYNYKVLKNDKFIVLGCDGLWDVMNEQEVTNYILLEYYDNNNKNINIANKLTNEAIYRGSTDNVTIIIIIIT